MAVGTGTECFVGIFRARRSRGLRRAQLRKNRSTRALVGARPRTSSVDKKSARWRSGFLLPRRSRQIRAWLWERARNATSGFPAHAGHRLSGVRRCANTITVGRWWVRLRALVRWCKGVRGGALLPRCAGSDTSGHDGGIGHGTILPGWPRTQVTGFLECAAAQKQKHSGTMTARPRTS